MLYIVVYIEWFSLWIRMKKSLSLIYIMIIIMIWFQSKRYLPLEILYALIIYYVLWIIMVPMMRNTMRVLFLPHFDLIHQGLLCWIKRWWKCSHCSTHHHIFSVQQTIYYFLVLCFVIFLIYKSLIVLIPFGYFIHF